MRRESLMRVGVTDNMGSEHKFQLYVDWILRAGLPIDLVKLSYTSDNANSIDDCDGLLLTGGNDVDPRAYGGPIDDPKIVGTDPKRDEFERGVIDRAVGRNIAILGICRGMQIANVHFGGTLVPDIEDAGYPSHKSNEKAERRHNVSVERGSRVFEISRTERGIVNSSHHQAVHRPGNGLKVVARSDDGIIEALEFKRVQYPFLMLLQWHPERMNDFENPLSSGILKNFLDSITAISHLNRIGH